MPEPIRLRPFTAWLNDCNRPTQRADWLARACHDTALGVAGPLTATVLDGVRSEPPQEGLDRGLPDAT